MSETARQIIEDAMSLITIFPDESTIEDSEMQLIRRELNRMMYEWETQGIMLGWTEITSVTEEVTVTPAAINGIIANLAVMIAPNFGFPSTPADQVIFQSVIGRAIAGKRNIRNIAVEMYPADFPSTLPQGSGQDYDYHTNDTYYSNPVPMFLMTNTGFTVTIASSDTPVVMGGTNWLEEDANMFDLTSAGKATFTGRTMNVRVKAYLYVEVASGTDDLTFYVAKNGIPIENSAVQIESTAGTNKEVVISKSVDVVHDDYIELYCKNNDTTENITVNHANFRVG